MFSLENALINGLLMSLAASVLIFGSLYINPRIWLQDYPEAIKAKVPPQTADEKRMQKFVAVPFFGLIIGTLVFSMWQLEVANGGTVSFLTAFASAFVIMNVFNLFDAVVIDYLILTLMKPKFAFIPGTEEMMNTLHDWRWQVGNFLKGIVFCTVFSVITALLAQL